MQCTLKINPIIVGNTISIFEQKYRYLDVAPLLSQGMWREKGVVGNLYKEDSLRYIFVKPLPEDRFVGERVSPPGWKLKKRCKNN
jgi:hypothetical protein